MRINRRTLAAGALAMLATPAFAQGFDATRRLARIESELEGRIGIAAIDTATGGRSFAYRGGERFAMCSTFKLLLACTMLQRVDRGEDHLFTALPFTSADLLSHAPVAQRRVDAGVLSLEEACAAIIEVSDNTAANLLLARLGGPAAFTRWLRGAGDSVTRLDRIEPALNENARGDVRDTTTPEAMADIVRRLLLTDAHLSTPSRERVWGWMQASRTGVMRVRSGLNAVWTVGSKTGTGAGAVNDVAIAYPRGAVAPWVIAAYVDAPEAEVAESEGAIRQAASAAAIALGYVPTVIAPPMPR